MITNPSAGMIDLGWLEVLWSHRRWTGFVKAMKFIGDETKEPSGKESRHGKENSFLC